MHYKYRFLFLLSVGFGILYDWISKHYLVVDSLLFLFIIHIFGLFFLSNYVLIKSIIRENRFNIRLQKFYDMIITYCVISILPVSNIAKIPICIIIFLYFSIKRNKVIINYLAMLRAIISVTGLCLIFECFSYSKLTQITSGYYAIPIGDFIFSSIMNDISGFYVGICGVILLIIILSKEILVNWIGFYFVCAGLAVILIIFMFVLSGIKKTKLRKINILFIASSIVILFLYNARPMAIVGSVLLSLADIFVQRFSVNDIQSENISFFLGCIVSSFVGLLFRFGFSWWKWIAIGTDIFPIPISDDQFIWFFAVSLLTIGIQFILNICFHKKSVIKFIPLRYFDLCIANVIEGEWKLSILSLILSSLFGYYI